MNRTLCIIKPDAIINGKMHEIIDIIKKNNFQVLYQEMRTLSNEMAEQLYVEHKEKPFYDGLVEFITSGDVMLIALSKENAVESWRDLMVDIRKEFGTDITQNAVHGSDSDESAQREFEIFFTKPVLSLISFVESNE